MNRPEWSAHHPPQWIVSGSSSMATSVGEARGCSQAFQASEEARGGHGFGGSNMRFNFRSFTLARTAQLRTAGPRPQCVRSIHAVRMGSAWAGGKITVRAPMAINLFPRLNSRTSTSGKKAVSWGGQCAPSVTSVRARAQVLGAHLGRVRRAQLRRPSLCEASVAQEGRSGRSQVQAPAVHSLRNDTTLTSPAARGVC